MQTSVIRCQVPTAAAAQAKARVALPVAMVRPMKAVGAGLAALALTMSANAATIKLGADSGALVFEPSSITVSKGESVTFVNNAGFPHNVLFDEDNVPGGVNVDAISHEDYLNAPGESFSLTFDTPGTYGYYCEPHQGAGMAGSITVN